MFIVLWIVSLYLLVTRWGVWSWVGGKGIAVFFLVFISSALATKENRAAARYLERSIADWAIVKVEILKYAVSNIMNRKP